MNREDLEAMLPEIQQGYDNALAEAKRHEGEFRRVQLILSKWEDPKPKDEVVEGEIVTDGEEIEDKAVDAQD